MTLRPCSREKEVAELLERGGWPQACAPDLRAHVSGCRSCGDLVLVTETFQRARAGAAGAARLASPEAIWWRAQLRRRNAAVERVGKPILGAQIFALAINLPGRRGRGWAGSHGWSNCRRRAHCTWKECGPPRCSIPAGASPC